MEHFRGFIEDYNTATMPHTKFYNYEQWEIQEYNRKQANERQQKANSDDFYSFNDEEELQRQRRKEKAEKEQNTFNFIHSIMKQDKSLQDDMKRQSELKLELTQAHKRGDMQTVKRLEKLLAPEDRSDHVPVKHPWS
jgi:pyruvate formate-lyase activating enzyme-like uncharacterized protein